MACPFALFARSSSSKGSSSSKYSTFLAEGPSKSDLTAQLKAGTWEAHREIEKSAGVRALMGSHHAELSIRFDRMDHLRFLVMLACIYLTMEDVLVHDDTALRDIMPMLVRSDALLEDIQAHLDEILDSRDAEVSELDHTEDDDARVYHESIMSRINAAQASLTATKMIKCKSLLTADHISLLTTRQAVAVQLYIDQIASLQNIGSTLSHKKDEAVSFTPIKTSPGDASASLASFLPVDYATLSNKSSENHVILAHAYVRYMGDLSGGQHIVKRLSKLFPIYIHNTEKDSNDVGSQSRSTIGFQFYSFTSTNKTTSELKEMIRSRMDSIQLRQFDTNRIIDEASEAFRLNRRLLDSLVDEDSTLMSLESFSSLSATTKSASMLLLSLPLYHPRTIAFITASVLFVGLASALYSYAL